MLPTVAHRFHCCVEVWVTDSASGIVCPYRLRFIRYKYASECLGKWRQLHRHRPVDAFHNSRCCLDIHPHVLGIRMIEKLGDDQLAMSLGRRPGSHSAAESCGGDVNLLARSLRGDIQICLLYTSDAADDLLCVDLGGR